MFRNEESVNHLIIGRNKHVAGLSQIGNSSGPGLASPGLSKNPDIRIFLPEGFSNFFYRNSKAAGMYNTKVSFLSFLIFRLLAGRDQNEYKSKKSH